MKNNIGVTIIAVVIVGAAAFFGGMQFQKSQAVSTNAQFSGQGLRAGAQGRFGANRRNGNATLGEVVSEDATSITLKLADGSSKIINVSSSTTYSKTSSASQSDVKTGDRIAVFGTANSDGSISAQNVQLNPMFRGFGPSTSPAPTSK